MERNASKLASHKSMATLFVRDSKSGLMGGMIHTVHPMMGLYTAVYITLMARQLDSGEDSETLCWLAMIRKAGTES